MPRPLKTSPPSDYPSLTSIDRRALLRLLGLGGAAVALPACDPFGCTRPRGEPPIAGGPEPLRPSTPTSQPASQPIAPTSQPVTPPPPEEAKAQIIHDPPPSPPAPREKRGKSKRYIEMVDPGLPRRPSLDR